MKPGHLVLCLLMILAPVSGNGADYHVNGATGHDSAVCGPLVDPCKTVKQAVDNTGDGTNVIKIAEGTYVEDPFGIKDAKWPHNDNIVTLEGGWNSDFTTNNDNRTATLLRTRNAGSTCLVNVFAGNTGNDGTVGLTLRCLSIENDPSGGITCGVVVNAESSGKARLTLDNVRMSSFVGSVLEIFSQGNEVVDITVNHSLFDHNPHPDGYLFWIHAQSGRINVTMKNSHLLHNGAPTVLWDGLFLHSLNSGMIDTRLENTIIADNTSQYAPPLYIYAENSSQQEATLINTTITDNTFLYYAGRGFKGEGRDQAHLTIFMTNSIVHGNHSPGPYDLYLRENDSSTVSYTGKYNIVDKYGEVGTPTHTTFQETDADPKLDRRYHLTSSSPAIDRGICGERNLFSYSRIAPWGDIDGDKRPGYGKLFGCDIGADEYMPFPWPMFLPAIVHQ